jgi:5-(carboxyamino)imidazole ribonucleotide mutase
LTDYKDKKITAIDFKIYNFTKKKFYIFIMKPKVSIIMGSTSDLGIMESAAKFLDELEIPFEMNALSAHRTPEKVEEFAKSAQGRGVQVIIAGAGMAAHLPGVIASMTPLPVIGVPIKATLDGMDALLSIVQMPPGIPVATVGINGARNAAILAAQILATADGKLAKKVVEFKAELKEKIVKANEELAKIKYKFKVNETKFSRTK